MTITVKLMGGLGNQLFQYACARNLADVHKTNLKLDVSSYDNDPNNRKYFMDCFNISASIADKNELVPQNNILSKLMFKIHRPSNYIKEKYFNYDPSISSLQDGVYLEGYWQSEKYFKRVESIIKKEFLLSEPPNRENRKLLEKINSCNSVSIHIRRGDYVTNAKTSELFGTCPIEYYQKGVEEIKKSVHNPKYFIFSDDPTWTKMNIVTGYPQHIIDTNRVGDAQEDLRLMSFCKHHIIANSSFSWWAAWLSNNPKKIVIAPKKWFNNYHKNEQDVVPNRWVRI